jgi:hypothetical protein
MFDIYGRLVAFYTVYFGFFRVLSRSTLNSARLSGPLTQKILLFGDAGHAIPDCVGGIEPKLRLELFQKFELRRG